MNPTLLVEVTSRTTEKKDRGLKLDDHRQIDALREYLIVSHERRELELWTCGDTGWTRQLVTEGTLTVASGAAIAVDALYANLPE
ncbi:MAG: Uma2 family endonuclease [Deltaproteobacteria bacterium]|nr:Uma2 family endonuclease [Deltaproteobacteria bacterium]